MQASDVMTRSVVSVTGETRLREVARILLEHRISAVPVLDSAGRVIGMISEGDLVGSDDANERRARRDWWLGLLAEGEALSPDFLASLRDVDRTAQDVMSAPVVTVDEATSLRDIARILADRNIKRVPVVRDGKVVGIVSRADLLRGMAAQ
jgi:CBS domain-containing protein